MKNDVIGYIRDLVQLRITLHTDFTREPRPKEIVLSPHMFRELLKVSSWKRHMHGFGEIKVTEEGLSTTVKGIPALYERIFSTFCIGK